MCSNLYFVGTLKKLDILTFLIFWLLLCVLRVFDELCVYLSKSDFRNKF